MTGVTYDLKVKLGVRMREISHESISVLFRECWARDPSRSTGLREYVRDITAKKMCKRNAGWKIYCKETTSSASTWTRAAC